MTGQRNLDGEINRALEGKLVVGVAKDGTFMSIFCSNGERWGIGWADFVKGVGFAGEPAIVSVDKLKLASGPVSAPDGGVHGALKGQVIESARTDGTVLYLKLTTGREYGIAWVDPKTQERIRAEPCLVRVDVTVRPEGVSVLGAPGMDGGPAG